jgi:hypothetical protein
VVRRARGSPEELSLGDCGLSVPSGKRACRRGARSGRAPSAPDRPPLTPAPPGRSRRLRGNRPALSEVVQLGRVAPRVDALAPVGNQGPGLPGRALAASNWRRRRPPPSCGHEMVDALRGVTIQGTARSNQMARVVTCVLAVLLASALAACGPGQGDRGSWERLPDPPLLRAKRRSRCRLAPRRSWLGEATQSRVRRALRASHLKSRR